ncbi:unnamed protein product [Diamesa serratosioi]
MEKIADISELCRVCLDSARELVPFNNQLHYTEYSIVDIIHFCTGVEYNDSEEENILPKHLCLPCLGKIHTAYELKLKCIESDKYLSSILGSTVPGIPHQELPGIDIDETTFMPSLNTVSYYGEPMDNQSSDGQSNISYFQEEQFSQPIEDNKDGLEKCKRRRGKNIKSSKMLICNICQKVFKYSKSYNRHMDKHKEEGQPEETYNIQISDHSNDGSYNESPEALSPHHSRSRSVSIEIIAEIDAIGEVYKITPDSDDNQDVAVVSTSRVLTPESLGKHRCNICGQSFALKIYLGNHKRRQHPGFTMIHDG